MYSSGWCLNVNQPYFSSLNELRKLREIVFGAKFLFTCFWIDPGVGAYRSN